jgi:hypothetical protein
VRINEDDGKPQFLQLAKLRGPRELSPRASRSEVRHENGATVGTAKVAQIDKWCHNGAPGRNAAAGMVQQTAAPRALTRTTDVHK